MKITVLQEQQIDMLLEKLNIDFDYEVVPVKVEEYSRAKQCYSNVTEKVERDGGKIYYGWSIHFNKGIIIEAERHAVWEDDNEQLLCVTPHPSGSKNVIFLPDNVPVDPSLQIDNVRLNITNNSLVNDWIHLSKTVGDIFYGYTDRKNDDEVIANNKILHVIQTLEEYRSLVMGLIKKGRAEKSNCFCKEGLNGKKYIHCHRRLIEAEITELVKSLEEFKLR